MQRGELHFQLLGKMILKWGEQDLIPELSQKEAIILCYLKVNGRSFSRRELESLFWPDMADPQASLRVCLNHLRTLGLSRCLNISEEAISFDQNSPHWSDVDAVATQMERAKSSDVDVTALIHAINLYRDCFLCGLSLTNLPAITFWLTQERERWLKIIVEALDKLVLLCIARGWREKAVKYTQKLVDLAPWHERGQRSFTLLQKSAAQTNSVARAIIKGEQHVITENQKRLPIKPTVLYIHSDNPLSVIRAAGSGRPVAIVGEGGMGKTLCIRQLAHALHELKPWEVSWFQSPDDLLESPGDWLACRYLLVDNVDKVDILQPFLTPPYKYTAVIATRSTAVANALDAHAVHLQPLAPEKSMRLFIQLWGVDVDDTMQTLVTQLCHQFGNHPFALTLIAKSLQGHHVPSLVRLVEKVEREFWGVPLSAKQALSVALRTCLARLKPTHRDLFQYVYQLDKRPFSSSHIAKMVSQPQPLIRDELDLLCDQALLDMIAEDIYLPFKAINELILQD